MKINVSECISVYEHRRCRGTAQMSLLCGNWTEHMSGVNRNLVEIRLLLQSISFAASRALYLDLSPIAKCKGVSHALRQMRAPRVIGALFSFYDVDADPGATLPLQVNSFTGLLHSVKWQKVANENEIERLQWRYRLCAPSERPFRYANGPGERLTRDAPVVLWCSNFPRRWERPMRNWQTEYFGHVCRSSATIQCSQLHR